MPQLVDVNDQVFLCLLHFRHGMRLQSQLLSEKRFDEHLDPLPFDGYNNSPQKIRCLEDSRRPLHRQPAASKILQLQLHFLERSPILSASLLALPSAKDTEYRAPTDVSANNN